MRIHEILKEFSHSAFMKWTAFLNQHGYRLMSDKIVGNEHSFIHYEDRTDTIIIKSTAFRGPIGWIRYKHGYTSSSGNNLGSLQKELGSQ